jgi:nicotinate-nucleotide pyrophosphorylase (carboxylating)
MNGDLAQLVSRALAEDAGRGDATTEAVIPSDARARARIIQKQPGVLFGLEAASEAFTQAGAASFDGLVLEGQWRDQVPADVAHVSGRAVPLLLAERTALNFLAHLSGVATLAARYVEAVRGTEATILDTRKTTPGLRALEKAAVAAGGATNHRMTLHDGILIKENHAALAGGVTAAVEKARAAKPDIPVEVECSDATEVAAALGAGADRLLLDNMDAAALTEAVAARDAAGSSAELEASGGVNLGNVAEIAATGVDFISIGALTHSAPALDLSVLLEPA